MELKANRVGKTKWLEKLLLNGLCANTVCITVVILGICKMIAGFWVQSHSSFSEV